MQCRPTPVFLDYFCKGKKCEQYIEWEWDDHAYGGKPMDMYSCMLVGQSHNVNAIPENCLHLKEIEAYELMALLGAEVEYSN